MLLQFQIMKFYAWIFKKRLAMSHLSETNKIKTALILPHNQERNINKQIFNCKQVKHFLIQSKFFKIILKPTLTSEMNFHKQNLTFKLQKTNLSHQNLSRIFLNLPLILKMFFKILILGYLSKRNRLKNIYNFLEIIRKNYLRNIFLTKIVQFLLLKLEICFKKQIH